MSANRDEREVFRINDAAHNAKVLRQHVPRIIDDEDTLVVELDTTFVVGLVEIERSLCWYVKESGVLERAFGAPVEPEKRIAPLPASDLQSSL